MTKNKEAPRFRIVARVGASIATALAPAIFESSRVLAKPPDPLESDQFGASAQAPTNPDPNLPGEISPATQISEPYSKFPPLESAIVVEESPIERWARILGVNQETIKILISREGGHPDDPKGIFQVTEELRESTYQEIPPRLLRIIVENDPSLRNLYPKGRKLIAYLDNPENLNEARLRVKSAFPQSEEIQTFWGLWVFSRDCQQYGDYLSFLYYNHPVAVLGFINQLMASLKIDRLQAIEKGNRLIKTIDEYLQEGKSPTIVKIEAKRKISYSRTENIFFWNFTIVGEAMIGDEKVAFSLRSAHYLWSLVIDQTSARKVAEAALKEAWEILGIAKETSRNQSQRKEIRRKLFDDEGKPVGILTIQKTGLGIMDLMRYTK